MCVMTETLVVIADNLKTKELPSIISSMSNEEQVEFVNSIRCLGVVADHISSKQGGCING